MTRQLLHIFSLLISTFFNCWIIGIGCDMALICFMMAEVEEGAYGEFLHFRPSSQAVIIIYFPAWSAQPSLGRRDSGET
jgi:hypothetical protein